MHHSVIPNYINAQKFDAASYTDLHITEVMHRSVAQVKQALPEQEQNRISTC